VNKQLIITGASRGIGYHTAAHFLRQGWQVTNLSRHPCTVEGVKNIPTDLLQTQARLFACTELTKQMQQPEVLCIVHNAALMIKDRSDQIDARDLRQSLELNVIAPSQINKALIPHCGAGSSIIYIGSTLSEKAVANTASYVTSKHAILGLMRATTQDLSGSGIHSACVCPGFTDTDMLREHIRDPRVLEHLAHQNALQRLVKPEEIADLIYYCATHPVINGAVLHANLGQLER
jgi:3-oxoacyl-[acyl-carrier protein] reductase